MNVTELQARLAEEAASIYSEHGSTPMSMTDATEALWGTSGRGSPKAVFRIETMARLGHCLIRGGRRRTVEFIKPLTT